MALSSYNNEAGFTAAQVRALCDLGASTKLSRSAEGGGGGGGGGGSGSIGRKGLGFKSVLCV